MSSQGQLIKIVLGTGIGYLFSTAVVLTYSFGVFVHPIVQDTGWDRTLVGSAGGSVALVVGCLSPFVGRLIDTHGARRVIIPSVTLLAFGMAMVGMLSHSAAEFFGLLLLTGALASGQSGVPYSLVISGWFDERRGTALGVALALGALGIGFVPVLASALIAAFGWRAAYCLLGLIIWLFTVPASLWLMRDPPIWRRSNALSTPGKSLRQAAATRGFWMMAMAFFFAAIATSAGTVLLPTVLAERGVSATRAALAMPFVGFAMIGGRIVFGMLLDRLFAPRLTALVFLCPMLGHILLAGTLSVPLYYIAAALFGFALGAESDALAYICSRAYGMRHLGEVFGALVLAFAAGTSAGPFILSLSLRYFGHYESGLWMAAGAASLAAILIGSIRRKEFSYLPASQLSLGTSSPLSS